VNSTQEDMHETNRTSRSQFGHFPPFSTQRTDSRLPADETHTGLNIVHVEEPS